MPIRVRWDEHEVALLINAYLQVEQGADLQTIAKQLSSTLREMAVHSGQSIDETYRNVNGMIMQLANVQYLFTDGKKGLSGASTSIRQMYELYRTSPVDYQTILNKAMRLTGTPTSIDASLYSGAEWEKLNYSMPDVYACILNNNNILVREFLKCSIQSDLPYTSLPLSARAINCLDRECLPNRSIQDILNMPLMQLASMKNAGKKTIREILTVVSEYVTSSYEEISSKTKLHVISNGSTDKVGIFRDYSDFIANEDWDTIEQNLSSEEEMTTLFSLKDIADVIGPEMVVTALRSEYPMTAILPMLNDFIQEEEKRNAQKIEIYRLISLLPDKRLDLPVKPYVDSWPIMGKKAIFCDVIDDIVVFREIPHLLEQLDEKELNALTAFLEWCQIDINTEIQSALVGCIKTNKQKEIIKCRADGQPLSEIASHYHCSRERIRQIEVKVVREFIQNYPGRIVQLISAERKGSKILTSKEIALYCRDDASLFLYLLCSIDIPDYRYVKSLDAFILCNEPLEEYVRVFVDELPDRIEEKELQDILKVANERGLSSELVDLMIRADYNFVESVRVWQRGKLSIREMCSAVLPSYDPDGIHVFSDEEIQDFRNRLTTMFGTEARVSETDRALLTIICKIGMLRDRGTYVAPREDILSKELLAQIQTYIDQNHMETLMFSTIFDVFHDDLLKVGVDNRYYLQGILTREWEGTYFFSKDCISKRERVTNIYGMVKEFIKNANDFVYTSEIREAFPGVTGAVLNSVLMQKSIISCNGRYIHADNLHPDEEIVQKLHETLYNLLSDGLLHNSKELYDHANTTIINWLSTMGIPYQAALFSIAAFLFDNEFVFARPWMAKKGSTGEETIRDLGRRIADEDDDNLSETDSQEVIEYKGTLIDIALITLLKANSPMNLQEIVTSIQENELYQFNRSNPTMLVYQALNNAILCKGRRNAMLGQYICTLNDDRGRKQYYLREGAAQVFANFSRESVIVTPQEEQSEVNSEIALRWNQIISEEFEDGLRLNGIRLRKFRSIYTERFHETLEFDDEELSEQLKQVCDFRDDRVYAKQDIEENTIISSICTKITEMLMNGATGIYPQQVFARYQTQLAEQLSVYTVDSLKAMLLSVPGKHYQLMYGIFCLPGKTCNPREDVLNLFKDSYEALNYTQIEKHLWYLPLDRIKHELVTNPSVVNIDQKTYFYAPNFPINTHELASLQLAIQHRIEDEGFLVAKDLRMLMQKQCPNAVMDTAGWKDWGIRNVMAWLLKDYFDFNGVIICAKGSGMDTHQVFRAFCRTRTSVTLDDIKTLCDQLDVTGIYWDSVFSEMIRVSKTDFISKSQIHFDVAAIDNALSHACSGEYMAIQDFTLFMTLPAVEYPWNGYLLESFLRGYSQMFYLNQAGPTEHTYIGAMVRRTSPIRTHQDLLIDVLSHDETWESAKEAFSVLREGGYRSYSVMTNANALLKEAHDLREKRKSAEK